MFLSIYDVSLILGLDTINDYDTMLCYRFKYYELINAEKIDKALLRI